MPGTYIKELKKYEKKPRKKKKPTITISGLSCSGKTSVAEYIAKKLGLKFIDAGGGFWRQIAKKRKIDLDKLSKTAEKKIDLEIDCRTLELAQKGGVVLMGRLVAWAAGDWADFRIMLTASEEERVRRSAERDGISLKKARQLVRGRDKEDTRRYMKYYKININDYSVYNLVLDTTHIPLKQNREIVLKIIKTAFS